MTEYTDEQVLANRRTWIEFLKDPRRRKYKSFLDNGRGARCCLGHACFVLRIPRVIGAEGAIEYGAAGDVELAPRELVEAVGLWSESGDTQLRFTVELGDTGATNLTIMNDETDMTPQQIGAYLETVIMGGPNTPFRPIGRD